MVFGVLSALKCFEAMRPVNHLNCGNHASSIAHALRFAAACSTNLVPKRVRRHTQKKYKKERDQIANVHLLAHKERIKPPGADQPLGQPADIEQPADNISTKHTFTPFAPGPNELFMCLRSCRGAGIFAARITRSPRCTETQFSPLPRALFSGF